jgi:hypothetical protein
MSAAAFRPPKVARAQAGGLIDPARHWTVRRDFRSLAGEEHKRILSRFLGQLRIDNQSPRGSQRHGQVTAHKFVKGAFAAFPHKPVQKLTIGNVHSH